MDILTVQEMKYVTNENVTNISVYSVSQTFFFYFFHFLQTIVLINNPIQLTKLYFNLTRTFKSKPIVFILISNSKSNCNILKDAVAFVPRICRSHFLREFRFQVPYTYMKQSKFQRL